MTSQSRTLGNTTSNFLPAAGVTTCLFLAACGSSSGPGSDLDVNDGENNNGGGEPPVIVPASATDMSLTSTAPREDGGGDVTVTFTMFIPEHEEGATFPLIVHSHGFGGSRVGVDEANADPATPADIDNTSSVFGRIDNQVRLLWDAGYAVVSFDQRGFGRQNPNNPNGDDGDMGNSGAIQIMDPMFETQDAIAVLDWVDDNVPEIARDSDNNIIAGAIGGSYGGGYQILLAALDDRLDALVPTDTWYSLIQSLLPNNVIKKAYTQGLCLTINTDNAEGGERVNNACTQAANLATSRYLEDFNDTPTVTVQEVIDAFTVNGLVEFQRRHNDPDDPFTFRPLDVLLVQGNRDILFNLTQAANSYRFFNSLGGDTRIITNESGHAIPTRALGGSQGALGPSTCGQLDTLAATRAWFDLKLRGNAAAEAALPNEVCISLDNTTGVFLSDLPVANAAATQFNPFTVTIPVTAITSQQNNAQSAAGQATFVGLANPIVGNNSVLAGIPIASLTIDDADALAAQNNGTTAFIGIGINRGGTILLVDDQAQPLRSSDPRTGAVPEEVPLIGIGEQLQDGDIPGVLIYGSFDQYESGAGTPANFSANNRFNISGSVRLPIVNATVQSR